ncbi:DUF4974 domain-containing protein (plasmid) [Pedobacter sp. BS3]|uniref:FecR family protein n=1 Tax=Pedobacter sp. BS3 TaxID=2567937 RepID=UPI0011EF6FBD|nr:FecR family protein [Pedobacter sp. BS3]TZF85996.1 DUF4974 domain-containing protein [Pedobacter sp. BS3]
MSDNIDHGLRIAYLIGRMRKNELTNAERAELDAWVARSEDNRQLYWELMQQHNIDQLTNQLKQFDEHAAARRFLRKTRRPLIIAALRYVSGVVAVLLIVCMYLYRNELANIISPAEMLQTAALKGQHKILHLEDGSTIWLSPGSTLKYPERFYGGKREVALSGEAFFEVTRDVAHPFIVHAGSIRTYVLGAGFNIQSYPEMTQATVTLLTGKVLVNSELQQEAAVELTPKQRAVFDRSSVTLRKENYPNAAELLDRRSGIYTYNGTPVTDIITDMQREYNMPIYVEGRLDNCTFYGKKTPDDDVVTFLRKVCISINATLRTDGKAVIITGNGCQADNHKKIPLPGRENDQ